ncbi:hypothetical protein ACFYKX_17385 [Cytobacillus sp. FJAT-54145]|uniref:Uncharacterized protein n=1 Tax=Cytobacillus spartinae TaxID=3299023 RepID=A0ABW6KDP0_9BACI
MEKNARGYVQESYTALNEAKACLQNALDSVEKGSNRERIEKSLQAVNQALNECGQTANVLEQV